MSSAVMILLAAQLDRLADELMEVSPVMRSDESSSDRHYVETTAYYLREEAKTLRRDNEV